ncbi:hypothetical protein L596_023675 [Steinernema carpocapsae]|uniref:Cullin family profile domain-containing protein n=1 Tax=Steinernema carpocapsae TaxID=34508 RepID=A0A4V5ZZM7_STECR|nr:hypothetical protein L596_023675 [Steinernema carpocapsae]
MINKFLSFLRPTEKSLPKPKMAGAQGLTLDTAWESLHEGLNAIYIGQRLSVKEYMGYYSKVHDFCANTQQQQNVRHRVPGHTRGSGSNSKGAEFAGRELYDKLKQYLQEHVEKIQDEMIAKDTEDELLIHYAMTWNKYAFSSKVVDGLFRYLNRHWIKREKDEGNKYVHDVYNLCLMLWKQVIFSKETSEGVTKAAIQLIARDRNGEKIQDELIKNVVDSLEQLGHEEETIVFSQGQIGRPSNKENPGFTEEQKKNLRVYLENFEEELLNVTDVYYSEEADQYLAHHSIVDYMIKVETRLQEEEGRVRRYLHLYSMVRVAESLENVFIANKLTELQSEFGKLLQQDRDADLTRLFKLCSRVDGALDRLRQEFLSFVTEKGKQAVAILETNDVGEVEARAYVGAILAIHQRYNGMVKDAFSGEAGFVSSFDRACNVFINNNVVTQKCAKVNKSAELLARYSDMILRKGGLKPGDDDVEVLITNTLTIFKYVDDKDIFQKFYTKMLAKRLTSDTSANQDAEGSMITKLKAMCGFEYTNKMQRMFTDVGLSQSLNEGFQNSSKKLACDFSTMVLGSGAWPLVQSFTCSIPKTLETCIESFRSFYTAQHQGRKLTWLLNMSRGELQTNGFNRKYTLITTTAQMAVLLMYNDTLTNTYGLLRKELDMQKEILLAVLQSFVKAGLIKLPEGTKISGALPEETQVTLNMKFTFKKMKIDLVRLQQAKFEAKQDAEQMEKNIEADRQLVIQAAIVRIMKMRKQCNHTNLITEIITQISTRFNPKIGMVKKCIDILMEKEYIKRSDKEKDMYEYIS